MYVNCGECGRRYYCQTDPAECDNLSRPVMDVREKLVGLLNEVQENGVNEIPAGFGFARDYVENEEVASHLIFHGVTMPEWISVDDRLPEEDGYYLCCIKSSLFPDRVYIDILECDKGSFEEGHIYTDTVTHWMLLPEPPKGE